MRGGWVTRGYLKVAAGFILRRAAETTLDPGDPATVGVSFDGTTVRFTFGIPRGDTRHPFGDPDDEVLRNKVTELILALRRNP